VVRRQFYHKLSKECSNIAFFLQQNINNEMDRVRQRQDKCEDSSKDRLHISSSTILSVYQRIQMKVKYLSELDSNRPRLISKIINQMSIVDGRLLDCKYISSVLFAANALSSIDRLDSIIASEYSILKRLVKQHRAMLDHEADFLNWLMSSGIDKSSSMLFRGVGRSHEVEVKYARIERSISELLQSGVLQQMERRISSYLYSYDPRKDALTIAAKTSSDKLLAPVKDLLESNLRIEASLDALQSKYLRQRDQLVHGIMRMQYRELQSRFVNRLAPTTETAERELRVKNVALLTRMQEVASKDSPFELRRLAERSHAKM
jgi:hypothetical protein